MLASEDHLTRNSYYLATAATDLHFDPLEGSGSCDVCIVGGGFAGLSAAIDLRRAGLEVVVLEAMQVGWGASGRNGGQALAGLACDMSLVQRQLGTEAARAIWNMTVEAVRLIHDRRREFAIDCQWQDGYIAAAIGPRKARDLHNWVEELERDYGYEGMRLIDGVVGAPVDRHVRATRRWHSIRAVAICIRCAIPKDWRGPPLDSARASTSIRARCASSAAPRPRVHTQRGQLRCRQVLLAGNVYLESLAPQLRNRASCRSAPSSPPARRWARSRAALVPSRAAVCDTQFVLDYFRLSADDRMLFGGRVSYSTVAPRRLRRQCDRRMLGVFPQ